MAGELVRSRFLVLPLAVAALMMSQAPDLYDRSPRLQQIAAEFREHTPVRVTDVSAVLNPDHPFRVLLANGREQRVAGDTVTTLQSGVEVETTRLRWPERVVRKLALRWRGYQLRRIGSR